MMIQKVLDFMFHYVLCLTLLQLTNLMDFVFLMIPITGTIEHLMELKKPKGLTGSLVRARTLIESSSTLRR